jgi:hypothetical protein
VRDSLVVGEAKPTLGNDVGIILYIVASLLAKLEEDR